MADEDVFPRAQLPTPTPSHFHIGGFNRRGKVGTGGGGVGGVRGEGRPAVRGP